MTGRYLLQENSRFINELKNVYTKNYDCIIAYIPYGGFLPVVLYKTNNCNTGLIGMRCKYVKQIECPTEYVAVEVKWAEATFGMNDANVCMVDSLGIHICPGNDPYFLI